MKALEGAQMQPLIREEVGLHWLYGKFDEHAGLIPFPDEACQVLRRLIDAKEVHSFTFSAATSARRLVEHWLDTRKLPMRHRGKIIDEQLSGVPAGDELSDYVDLNESLDGQTIVCCSDLIRLMRAENMTVPGFLLADEFVALLAQDDAADRAQYNRTWELYDERDIWSNMKHQNDPDKFEKIQARLARIDVELAQLIPGSASLSAPPKAAASKFTQLSALQEQTILAWLAANGWNASQLPKPPAGKSGVKQAARAVLQKQPAIFRSERTFNKAWERLRGSRLIADKE
jgi:hypothetical protein